MLLDEDAECDTLFGHASAGRLFGLIGLIRLIGPMEQPILVGLAPACRWIMRVGNRKR